MEKKMTKKDYFNQLLSMEVIKNDKALVDFIKHELELLDKKSASRPSKNAKENDEIKARILEKLEKNTLYRAKDIVILLNNDYTSPRVVAILKKMQEDKTIKRIEEKGVAYFSLM